MGYLEDVLSRGTTDGAWLELPNADYFALKEKYNPPKLIGLGDVVAMVAQPVARAIDRVAGTNIEHCSGCAKRRAALNAAVPFSP